MQGCSGPPLRHPGLRHWDRMLLYANVDNPYANHNIVDLSSRLRQEPESKGANMVKN